MAMKLQEPDLVIPYFFDTRAQGRFILKVVIGFIPIFATFAAIMMAFSGMHITPNSVLAVLGLVALLHIVAGFMLYRQARGAHGTVGRTELTIEPDFLFGITTKAHRGSFKMAEFTGVQLKEITAKSLYSVVSLLGDKPALRVVVGVGPHHQMRELSEFLAKELSLQHYDLTEFVK